MSHDGAADGNPLTLPTRELARQPFKQRRDAQHRRRRVDTLLYFWLGELACPQPEGDVVVHRQMRVKRVILEHHRDIAITRPQLIDHPAPDLYLAAADVFETCDASQQRALTAARWANEDDKFAVVDAQVDALEGMHRSVVFVQVFYSYVGHANSLLIKASCMLNP